MDSNHAFLIQSQAAYLIAESAIFGGKFLPPSLSSFVIKDSENLSNDVFVPAVIRVTTVEVKVLICSIDLFISEFFSRCDLLIAPTALHWEPPVKILS